MDWTPVWCYGWGVELYNVLTIALGMFTLGVLRETHSGYKVWKARRFLQPAAVRNAGFITDTKLKAFEITVGGVVGVWAVGTLLGVAIVIGAIRGWWSWPYWL